MFRRIFLAVFYVFNQFRAKLNPIGYARAIGVKVGVGVSFYGMRPGMFSTEPWLITIGDHCHITNGCQFITHDGGTLVVRKEIPDLEITAPIKVGNNVYIGLNTMILPGVTIGDNVIVGAGSVVSSNIPSNSVAAGVPAKVIKSLDSYKEKASSRSLHLGHLKGKEKAEALKRYFNVN